MMTDPRHARIAGILRLEAGLQPSHGEYIATRILSDLAAAAPKDERVEQAVELLREVRMFCTTKDATVSAALVRGQLHPIIRLLSAPNPPESPDSSQPGEKADCPECHLWRKQAIEIDANCQCSCGKRHERKRE